MPSTPEAPAALCKAGLHEMTPDNSYTRPQGGKAVCRTCTRDRYREWERKARGKGQVLNAQKTHCKRGHEFTPDNTKLDTRGHRTCRTCSRGLQARFYKRRRPPIKLTASNYEWFLLQRHRLQIAAFIEAFETDSRYLLEICEDAQRAKNWEAFKQLSKAERLAWVDDRRREGATVSALARELGRSECYFVHLLRRAGV
jgi:hypothetical protein